MRRSSATNSRGDNGFDGFEGFGRGSRGTGIRRVPQVGVLADLCSFDSENAQVCEYADLWHP